VKRRQLGNAQENADMALTSDCARKVELALSIGRAVHFFALQTHASSSPPQGAHAHQEKLGLGAAAESGQTSAANRIHGASPLAKMGVASPFISAAETCEGLAREWAPPTDAKAAGSLEPNL
jgi:hypothetical protein